MLIRSLIKMDSFLTVPAEKLSYSFIQGNNEPSPLVCTWK